MQNVLQMKWPAFWAVFLIGIVSSASADEFPRYHIRARIDAHNKKLSAHQTVSFTNTTSVSLNELYFHIYPNRTYTLEEKKFMFRYGGYFKVNPYPGGLKDNAMVISSVTQSDSPLSFLIEGEDNTLLKISLKEPLMPGQSIEVAMDFSVAIPHAYGRFGWHDNIFAVARWYPILAVVDDKDWNKHPFYPFHRPFFSSAAYYSVDLTVPSNQVVIHTGDMTKEELKEENTKVLSIQTPLPVREFAFTMSPDYKLKEGEFEGIKIKSFYLPQDETHAELAIQNVKDLMKYYGKYFGPYPYKEFSLAPVHLGYGGEQMPNMAFIDTRVYRLPRLLDRYFDFLITHETGHQWFYNLVGTDEFIEMWLEEGVNSYFDQEYLEDKYGKGAGVVTWPEYLDKALPNFAFKDARDTRYKMIARTHLNHRIVGKLSSFQEPSAIFSLTYGKGSAIVSMLRTLIGDEHFFNLFARIFKEYRFKNLSIADFVRLVKEETRQDYAWFFDEWLNKPDVCDYAVTAVKGKNIFIENRGRIDMPRDIKIKYQDGKEKTMTIERWDQKVEELTMDESTPIKQVVLDPDHKLLDIDRTNNTWPRQVRAKFVPLYFGVYEIPVFLPDDSYNWVTGPELANNGLGIKTSLQKPYDWLFYTASDYEFSESILHSRLGYQLKNVFHSLATAGVEVFNDTDYDGGEEDLAGGKVYLRRELWPAAYGLGDINDHVTLYLLRDRSLGGDLTTSGLEDSRGLSYLKKDEAIVGTNLHFGRSGPWPDPVQGYRLDSTLESSGHFLGATQYFYRSSLDGSYYWPVTPQTRLAARLKYGWGFPDDKNLYELGGMDGLRGFDRKTLRGSNIVLGALEYRFPLIQKMDLRLADNIVGFESVGGVVFFDAGKNWYDNFDDAKFSRDAGVGLRVTVNIGSFLEKAILRLDIAKPIDAPQEDTHVWFGVNQAF